MHPQIRPGSVLRSQVNIERRWKQWLQNYESLKVSLINLMHHPKESCPFDIDSQKLRELFSTLTPAADSYKAAKTILTTHFT